MNFEDVMPSGMCNSRRNESSLIWNGAELTVAVSGLSAQFFAFDCRSHLQMSIAINVEHTRKSHGAGPARRGELGFGARLAHPSPQDAAAIGSDEALGRVIGRA